MGEADLINRSLQESRTHGHWPAYGSCRLCDVSPVMAHYGLSWASMGPPKESPQVSSQIDRLRQPHTLWAIGSVWMSAASGPDARRLTASREGIQVHGWTEAELSRKIADEEAANGWPCT